MPDPLLDLLPKARRKWAKAEPRMAELAKLHKPAQRSVEVRDAFEALVTSITHQQVSMAAGRSIQARVAQAAGGSLTPRGILAAGPESLRAAGLSRPKVAYVLDLAQKVDAGEVDLPALEEATDEEVVATLTSVKGIGVWTAKMFMLFFQNRPDVVAHEDLGLQIAVAHAYRVPRAQAARKIQRLAPAWSPYNSVAAMVLWQYHHAIKAPRPARPASRARPSP